MPVPEVAKAATEPGLLIGYACDCNWLQCARVLAAHMHARSCRLRLILGMYWGPRGGGRGGSGRGLWGGVSLDQHGGLLVKPRDGPGYPAPRPIKKELRLEFESQRLAKLF